MPQLARIPKRRLPKPRTFGRYWPLDTRIVSVFSWRHEANELYWEARDSRQPVESSESTMNYEDLEGPRIKHLELIQNVITRLGGNGFLIKGWALTVAGAFLGFAVSSKNRWLAVASCLPTVTFWGLDAYFLRSERLFRKLYGRVRQKEPRLEPFFMSATHSSFIEMLSLDEQHEISYWRTLRRPALFWFYLAILISAFAVYRIVLHIT